MDKGKIPNKLCTLYTKDEKRRWIKTEYNVVGNGMMYCCGRVSKNFVNTSRLTFSLVQTRETHTLSLSLIYIQK